MPRTYNEALILCPFYQSMGYKSITCEGITEDSIIKVTFNTPDKRDEHRNLFCEKRYKNCEICAMLEKKYEE